MREDVLSDYAERGIVPPGPGEVHVDIIHDCNLTCPACWIHSPLAAKKRGADTHAPEPGLSMENFLRIRDELASVKVKKIIISGGGEPFLHTDIYRMIAALRDARMRTTVLSNGMLIDPERLKAAPPSRIVVNYTAYIQLKDQKAGLELLAAVGAFVPLNLVLVVDTSTLPWIPELLTRAAAIQGTEVTFKPASLTEETEGLALTLKDREELSGRLLPWAKKYLDGGNIRHNIDMFAERLEKADLSDARRFGCYAGIFYSRIYTNGDVFYCCAHIKTGNIFETSFTEIWRGERYEEIRRQLGKGEFFPCCAQCGKYNLNYEASKVLQRMGRWRKPEE